MRKAWIVSLVLVAAGSIACSAASKEEDASSEPLVEGTFRLAGDTPSAAIREIDFHDGHYTLTPSGCEESSCKERGTFAVDRANHTLELAVDGTGRLYELPFKITEAGPASSATGPAGAESVETALAAAGDSLVTGGDRPVVGEGEALANQSKLTVRSFELLEQVFLLDETDACHQDWVWVAARICATAKTPTRSPRTRCVLKNDTDHCNGGSQASCLKDTPGNNALSRFDQYQRECREAGNFGRETEVWENRGMQRFAVAVCCKTFTCADGERIDGTRVTGRAGETVCGRSGTKWWCAGGTKEGVGVWQNLDVPCTK